MLLRNGLITLANDARRDVVYDTFISDPSRTSADDLARYGLSTLTLPVPSVLPGQFVGKSAGAAILGAPVASIGAVLDGSVRMSEVQRISAQEAGRDPGLSTHLSESENNKPLWNGLDDLRATDRTVKQSTVLSTQPQLFASLRPTAGLLVLGREVGADGGVALNSLQSAVRVTGQNVSAPRVSADMDSQAWAQLLNQVGTTTVLSTAQLQRAGLGGVTLPANNIQYGNAATQDAANLQLAAGGSFVAKAREGDVVLHGSITTSGGTIGVTAQTGDVLLTTGSRLDAGGTRRDERLAGFAPTPALQGGSVSLTARGDITLAQGSEIDVSGTAWRGTDGKLTKGRAGTLTLTVNDGASAVSKQAMPSGVLTLAGTLSGFDFTGGGTLKLNGLSNVAIGGARKGAFSLPTNLYADRGFGSLEVSALGQVDVQAGTQIKPVLVNLQALSSAYSYVTGTTYALATLEQGLRSGNNLTLTANTQPAVAADAVNGYVAGDGADVTVGKGAVLDMGLGGSITLKAGGNIEMAGTLRAQGGKVSLGLLGERGVVTADSFEQYGYVSGQSIHLADGSLIDVSGAVKAVEKRSSTASLLGLPQPLVGEVLAGGP